MRKPGEHVKMDYQYSCHFFPLLLIIGATFYAYIEPGKNFGLHFT